MERIKEIGRLLLILALQVLLFDHLHISMWGFPMVYILFLITLPPLKLKWVEMIIGFAVGLIMDIWHSSMGVHIAACVAIAFLRPILLSNFVQEIERINDNVSGSSIGLVEYVKCVVILTILHHAIVFSLEAWDIQSWWIVLLQTIISSALTIAIILSYDRLK